jgi:hypothetical protein
MLAWHALMTPPGAPPTALPTYKRQNRHTADLLVSPSDDGRLFVWSYSSGRLLAAPAGSHVGALPEAELPLAAAAVHPREALLASAGADSVVRLWEPQARGWGSGAGAEPGAAQVLPAACASQPPQGGCSGVLHL